MIISRFESFLLIKTHISSQHGEMSMKQEMIKSWFTFSQFTWQPLL